jgi:hypothetical protein
MSFVNVLKETYTDPITKEPIIMRAIHFKKAKRNVRDINFTGKEIDNVALTELGSYERVLDILEHNAQIFTEYVFDTNYISVIGLP